MLFISKSISKYWLHYSAQFYESYLTNYYGEGPNLSKIGQMEGGR